MDFLVTLIGNLFTMALIGFGVYWFVKRAKSNHGASKIQKAEQSAEFTGVTNFSVGEPVLVAQDCPFIGDLIDGLKTNVLAVGMRGTVVAVHRTPVEIYKNRLFFKPKSSGYHIIFGHDKVLVQFGYQHLLVRPVV
jgi:hypothetical protein